MSQSVQRERMLMFAVATAAVYLYTVQGQLDQYSADTAAADGGLEVNIPGIPGEDYPIYANVPDTGFTCDGLVEGGYYADPDAECQVGKYNQLTVQYMNVKCSSFPIN